MNKKQKIQNAASYWSACEKEGMHLSEQKLLKEWLNEDSEHQEAYLRQKKIEQLFSTLPSSYLDELEQEALHATKKTKIIERVKRISVAALFLLMFFSSGLQFYNYYSPTYTNTLTTQIEPIKEFSLPDGSKLAIDVKTSLKVKYFDDKRYVKLDEGQVLFDVAKNKEQPFIIESGNTHIQVVGTSFEVRKLNGKTTVKVVEGKVKISKLIGVNNKEQALTLLTRGEQITLDTFGSVLELTKTSLQYIASWKEDTIHFHNTTIKEAVEELSRYTNNVITIKNKKIESLLVTGKFSTTQIDKFFNALGSIYSISIEKNGQNITLK